MLSEKERKLIRRGLDPYTVVVTKSHPPLFTRKKKFSRIRKIKKIGLILDATNRDRMPSLQKEDRLKPGRKVAGAGKRNKQIKRLGKIKPFVRIKKI